MKRLAILAVAALAMSACDRAREVATDIGISQDAQDFCSQLFGAVIPGRATPVNVVAITAGLQASGVACLLEVVRDVASRRVVDVVAVEAPPSLAGQLVTAEPVVAAQIDEAVLVTESTAEALSEAPAE